jgi:hypothetical protein
MICLWSGQKFFIRAGGGTFDHLLRAMRPLSGNSALNAAVPLARWHTPGNFVPMFFFALKLLLATGVGFVILALL